MSIDSAAFAAAFPLRTWRLELTAEADADLGRVPSGIVRSALGPALLEAVCHLPEPACDTCPERKDCAWPNAFRPLPRAGRYQNPPVPYILSWRGTGDLRAGHQARLHLTLIGEAQRYAEDWLEALRRALGRGLGSDRVPFTLDRVTDEPAPSFPSLLGDSVGVELLTPVDLRRHGEHLARFDLDFFLDSLVRRLSTLHALWCDGPPLDEDWLRDEVMITLASNRTRRVKVLRPRQGGRNLEARGLQGEVIIAGEVRPLLPLLALATRTGVGRGASACWGCGQIALFDPLAEGN